MFCIVLCEIIYLSICFQLSFVRVCLTKAGYLNGLYNMNYFNSKYNIDLNLSKLFIYKYKRDFDIPCSLSEIIQASLLTSFVCIIFIDFYCFYINTVVSPTCVAFLVNICSGHHITLCINIMGDVSFIQFEY